MTTFSTEKPLAWIGSITLIGGLAMGCSSTEPPTPADTDGSAPASSQTPAPWPPPEADRSEQENEKFSARQLQTVEKDLPDLARSMGAKTIYTLREETCQLTSGPLQRPRLTRIKGIVAVDVRDEEVARKVGASVRTQAERQGWITRPEEDWGSGAGPAFYQGYHPDLELTLTLTYRDDGERPRTILHATGQCLEMPKGHLMTVSRLDRRAIVHADGDGVDTHQVPDAQQGPVPLPESTQTPAPTGPEGVTAEEPHDPDAPTPSPTSTKGFLDDAVRRP